MRCNNCCRHVENHEKMFRKPVQNTIGNITTRRVELVCEDCLPEIDNQVMEFKETKRKRALVILIVLAVYFVAVLAILLVVLKP